MCIRDRAYSLVCLSSALSNFIWSPLTDKFGRKSVFIFVMACEGLVMIALFLLLRTGRLDTALVYVMSVSYTHLDVYKRQPPNSSRTAMPIPIGVLPRYWLFGATSPSPPMAMAFWATG